MQQKQTKNNACELFKLNENSLTDDKINEYWFVARSSAQYKTLLYQRIYLFGHFVKVSSNKKLDEKIV